ncbi:DNA-directed RNA polymerase III subunit RPC4 [Aplochiton taeniatus]
MTDPSDANNAAGCSANGNRAILTPGRGLQCRVTGLSSPPAPGRLTSLRSRDLTLGGFKKKTFVPNVQAVRKTKDELKEAPRLVQKKERRNKEDRNRENRGKRRERPPTIQSHSIFEQGPADSARKTAWRAAADLRDTSSSSSSSSSVAKCVKKERPVSEEEQDEILTKLQRDDFIDDPSLKNEAKMKPIQLPLYQSSSFLKTATLPPFKEESMATETPLFKTPTSRPPGARASFPSAMPRPEQQSVAELLRQLSLSDREELLFIQLPDSMPGRPPAPKTKGPSAPSEKSAKKEAKTNDKRTTHLQTQEPVGKESDQVLADFSEGLLGKLQIRKSGKVQLLLGDITMDVSGGAAFSFLQQLVSVRLSEGLTGDMSVLGNVHHKLVCSPDFQALLQGAPSPSQRRTTQS